MAGLLVFSPSVRVDLPQSMSQIQILPVDPFQAVIMEARRWDVWVRVGDDADESVPVPFTRNQTTGVISFDPAGLPPESTQAPQATLIVSCVREGMEFEAVRSIQMILSAATPEVLVVTLQPAHGVLVGGQVRDVAGDPVLPRWVKVFRRESPDEEWRERLVARTITQSGGFWIGGEATDDHWLVRVTSNDHLPAEIEFEPGSWNNLVTVQEGIEVRGSVRAPDGLSLQSLHFLFESGINRKVFGSDQQGTVLLRGVESGPGLVTVFWSGAYVVQAPVLIQADHEFNLDLEKYVSMAELVLTDRQGLELEDVQLWQLPEDDGRFAANIPLRDGERIPVRHSGVRMILRTDRPSEQEFTLVAPRTELAVARSIPVRVRVSDLPEFQQVKFGLYLTCEPQFRDLPYTSFHLERVAGSEIFEGVVSRAGVYKANLFDRSSRPELPPTHHPSALAFSLLLNGLESLPIDRSTVEVLATISSEQSRRMLDAYSPSRSR